MAPEIIDSVPWEAEEAEFSESEEAVIEAEESEEAYRRPRRQKRTFQPARGVQGITLRGRDGTHNVQFPTKLATVAETNRGLASQELARRALDERLDRLETRFKGQLKKDTATTGVVALAVGGGLSTIGAFQAANAQGGTSVLGAWATRETTKMAAVVSATQLVTSGAKLAFNGRYVRSGFGIAADVFSLLQISLFTYGRLHTPAVIQETDATVAANAALFASGTQIFNTGQGGGMYRVVQTNVGRHFVPA
jgi:hypothetical protein